MAIWNFTENDAHGCPDPVKPFQTYSEEQKTIYSREASQQKMQQKSHADRGWEHISYFER